MSQSIRQAVMQASQAWIADFNRQAFADCIARYLPGAQMQVSPFGRFDGIEAISQFWLGFAQQNPGELVYRNVEIKVLSDKQAILSANWRMNIASGFISKELWTLADDGHWYLEEDDFSVLTQLSEPLAPRMRSALVLVDLQNDYFKGGRFALDNCEAAAANAAKLLHHFRSNQLPVIHVQHIFKDPEASFFQAGTQGVEIADMVAPKGNEPVIIKHHVDSFIDTALSQTLVELGIDKLVVVGAMAQACVQTLCRSAVKAGFECEVISDAIAAPSLSWESQDLSGQQLVAANLISLSFGGAKAISLNDWLIRERLAG
ncbi:cysteine hydrolase [Shewanella rhizosphaerae]|uniref:cysteine hydrolase family protein n=1 Tax=Shewanella rhizosphaerae TaxID=2864207 RepID=UPI001C659536|nr:cysteine hydrolase family protein [Shewanella rhizosphaerae]QYK13177.1 cysteine hydrolase [Shewanella rhizosphaerae]